MNSSSWDAFIFEQHEAVLSTFSINDIRRASAAESSQKRGKYFLWQRET
jgi:hypothetical protein